MEQKDIDIYEILKDVEYGTELYTSKCGRVWFSGMANDKDSAKAIWTEDEAGREHFFDKNGKIDKEGEPLLFPSKEMRDWSKFFKKGDVLICYEGKEPYYTIFDGFGDNTYRAFKGKFAHDCYEDKWYQNEGNLSTNTFQKLNRADSEIYVTKIEECFGGKLNRETLEIEKPQPEFKDGDIVVAEEDNYYDKVIFIAAIKDDIVSKALINVRYEDYEVHYNEYRFGRNRSLRLATEEEKQQLFSALAKEGKAWDADKKMIVNLKPAFEIGKLYVFNEDDEDGELTIIGKLIGKNESEDTLTFGNQYEIENEKFVTDQTFDLHISVSKELREATEGEVELFNKHYAIWKKEKGQPAKEQAVFEPFDKVLVRNGKEFKWLPAFFVRDRGEDFASRYNVLPLHSGKAADFTQCIPYEGHENFAFTDYDFVDLPF
ncbi:hypothetical protein [Segatella copri]|uniref:Uncharacterized protein n=1 Tax=Segatella copri TaxID=165179 RepID=A0AA92W8R2_9BACT|nr:hypothetical protein [Segatella copri]RGW71063.1 hypothetical protein DWV60_00685 [Segatella copri]